MTSDERVEAAARAVGAMDSEWRSRENHLRAIAATALVAAGLDDLEAENARLREALHLGVELDNHHNAAMCPYCRPDDDTARRELADLRAGVEALAGGWERALRSDAPDLENDVVDRLDEMTTDLRALLAAAPSEPAQPTVTLAFDGTRDSDGVIVHFGEEYLQFTCNLCADGTTVAGPGLRFHLLTKHPEAGA